MTAAVGAQLADDPVLYGAYVAAWAFFAYGPQLVICMLFAWSACRRVHGDQLVWLTRGFLWSLLPFVGIAAMWWIWRGARRRPAGGAAAGGGSAPGATIESGATAGETAEPNGPAKADP